MGVSAIAEGDGSTETSVDGFWWVRVDGEWEFCAENALDGAPWCDD